MGEREDVRGAQLLLSLQGSERAHNFSSPPSGERQGEGAWICLSKIGWPW
jgi:hypothetical protein